MLTLRPARRRMIRRIATLPTAQHDCARHGVWVKRPKVTGKLACVVCGKP